MEKVREMLDAWGLSEEQHEEKCKEAEQIIERFHMTEEGFVGCVTKYKKTHEMVTQMIVIQQAIEKFVNL